MRTEQALMKHWRFALSVNGETPSASEFKEIALPHDWAAQGQAMRNAPAGEAQGFLPRGGVGWYTRELPFAAPIEGRRAFLDFGGVSENCTIYVNEKEVAYHAYEYSPFRVEVTDALREASNRLTIKVDCTQTPADRWYSGCGIYRPVKWIQTCPAPLNEQQIAVRYRLAEGCAYLSVITGTNQHVAATLTAPDGTVNRAEGSGTITMIVDDPRLWSAESPTLYTLALELIENDDIIDNISMRVGFRSVELKPNEGLFINGRHTVLRGVCLHQDFACVGVAVTPELWRVRLLQLKSMGCDFIRAAHHVYDAAFLDLCDELGFYVYEECFDKWRSGSYNRYWDECWQSDVDAMVLRDRNRPSVLIWGVGNEVERQGQPSMLNMLNVLVEHVRSMDNRPVTYAMNPHFKRPGGIDPSKAKDIQKLVDEVDELEITDLDEKLDRICDIGKLVDIISCNYQEQWYAHIHERMPSKLILGTEVYQYFMGKDDAFQNYTERMPCLVPETLPYVIGSAVWTGFDYLGESMGWPSKGWSGSLIRTDGTPRFSYYLFQSHWTQEPMIHLSVLDYSIGNEPTKEHWALPPYEDVWDFPNIKQGVVPYAIATNCDTVEIQIGERVFRPEPVGAYPNRMIHGFLPYHRDEVEARGYIKGHCVCSHRLATPSTATRLEFVNPPRRLPAQEGYMVFLTVTALDEALRCVIRENREVHFTVEGAAELIATDSGDLTDPTPYSSSSRPLWHGHCSVLLRLSKQAGTVYLQASAQGLASAEITLTIC